MGGGDVAPHGTTIVAISLCGVVFCSRVIAERRWAISSPAVTCRRFTSRTTTRLRVLPVRPGSQSNWSGSSRSSSNITRRSKASHLTFDGKANRLSSMVRGNLGAAMQGLAVVPLLVGYDLDAVDPSTAGPHRLLRRRRWAIRGARGLSRSRIRLPVREIGAQEAVFTGNRRGHRASVRRRGALRRGR